MSTTPIYTFELLGKKYSVANPVEVVNFLGSMSQALNGVAQDVIKIGSDVHRGAELQRSTAEWLRRNTNGGALLAGGGNGGNGTAAALLAAVGLGGQQSPVNNQLPPAQPQPQPTPQPANPHKTGMPTISSRNPLVTNNNGSIDPPVGHTMSDLVMQITVLNGSVFLNASSLICHVTFSAPFVKVPNVNLSQTGPYVIGNVYPASISTSGFDLVAGQGFAASDSLTLNITVAAAVGDPTY